MKTYTSEQLAEPQNAKLVSEMACLLAHAMTDDFCTKWLFSNHSHETYVAALPSFMRMVIQTAITCQATFKVITKDEVPAISQAIPSHPTAKKAEVQFPPDATIRALAIVIPPHGNAAFDSLPQQLRAGWWATPIKFGVRLAWRLWHELIPRADGMHHAAFPNPATKYHHWHLFYLVVHSDNRNQGLGEKLLRDIQQEVRQFNEDEASKTKLTAGQNAVVAPLYLEASSHINKRLYNRIGFEDNEYMVYGSLADGEDLNMADDGRVLGGKQFGMVWTP